MQHNIELAKLSERQNIEVISYACIVKRSLNKSSITHFALDLHLDRGAGQVVEYLQVVLVYLHAHLCFTCTQRTISTQRRVMKTAFTRCSIVDHNYNDFV